MLAITYLDSTVGYFADIHDLYQLLANVDVNLKFKLPFSWFPVDMSSYLSKWLMADDDAKFSIVGAMSTTSFASALEPTLDG